MCKRCVREVSEGICGCVRICGVCEGIGERVYESMYVGYIRACGVCEGVCEGVCA